MNCFEEREASPDVAVAGCDEARGAFSAYLDGALDGHTMGELAAHLEQCSSCKHEFEAWRSMQSALGALGPAAVPAELQSRLRDRLASEISTKRHLSPFRRFEEFYERTLAPAGLRFGAGLAATLVILGSAACFLSTALPVQANDDRMAHMSAPRYLYSQAPNESIVANDGSVAVLLDAKVDADGRVYDFDLIDGPKDAQTRLSIEANLLNSVFKPATVFGEAVPGHAMMTYTTVSARR